MGIISWFANVHITGGAPSCMVYSIFRHPHCIKPGDVSAMFRRVTWSYLVELDAAPPVKKKATANPKCQDLASGKRLHNYGKSPFFMGKLTIDGHFQ